MRKVHPSKQAGFTLVEVLVLMFAISFLSVAAILNFQNSNITLDFLSAFKEFRSEIRAPRSYAINNKTIENSIPPAYGVYIGASSGNEQQIIVFADNGQQKGVYDPPSSDFPDTIMTDGQLTIDNDQYIVSAWGSTGALALPVTLFYESGSATMDSYENGNIYIPKDSDRYVALRFQGLRDTDLKKYLVIFQVAGLAEEANKLPNEIQ